MTAARLLRSVLGTAGAVLFDFDGPLCAVFAGCPSPRIAAELLTLLPDDIDIGSADELRDPLEVLRRAGPLGPEIVNRLEDSLVAAELQAVHSATPTLGGALSLRNCRASGRRAAIVSNNSEAAILRYLADHELTDLVEVVIGREYGRPEQMKPAPQPINRALRALATDAADAVLVGDSVTDVEAARAAGVRCVGLANKPAKWTRLVDADVVIGDMVPLAEVLTSSDLRRVNR